MSIQSVLERLFGVANSQRRASNFDIEEIRYQRFGEPPGTIFGHGIALGGRCDKDWLTSLYWNVDGGYIVSRQCVRSRNFEVFWYDDLQALYTARKGAVPSDVHDVVLHYQKELERREATKYASIVAAANREV